MLIFIMHAYVSQATDVILLVGPFILVCYIFPKQFSY